MVYKELLMLFLIFFVIFNIYLILILLFIQNYIMLNMVNLVSFKTSIYHILKPMEIIYHYIKFIKVKDIIKVNYFN